MGESKKTHIQTGGWKRIEGRGTEIQLPGKNYKGNEGGWGKQFGEGNSACYNRKNGVPPPLLVCDTAPVNTCASVCAILQCVCVQKYRPIPLPNNTHTEHCLVTYSRLPACQGGSQFCYRLSEVKEKTISRHILNLGEKTRSTVYCTVCTM